MPVNEGGAREEEAVPEARRTARSRWRLPLLALGFVALVMGVAGGLARLTPFDVPVGALALHGALMVSAFLGTLIALERAAALGRPWGYLAPLACGLGGLALVAGWLVEGLAAMALGAAVFAWASLALWRRHPSLESATLLAGAAAWLLGNLGLLAGWPAVPWWMAFFALTVGGERLELSRYLKRPRWVRIAFVAIASAVFASPIEPRLLGAALALLALWLLAFDLARTAVRQPGLPRYIAACLLAGYFWLAVGGMLVALEQSYDAALHAVFVGFVLSMVFGHAPVILPAVLRVRLPWHPALYAPLALLHASLAVRVAADLRLGAWGNAAAIALFIATVLVLVFRRKAGSGPVSP